MFYKGLFFFVNLKWIDWENLQKTSFPFFLTHPLYFLIFFFCNKTGLSFTPKCSTLVLYRCLHTQWSWLSPLYHSCLQVYNLEVLRLLLFFSCISHSCLPWHWRKQCSSFTCCTRTNCSAVFPSLDLASMFYLVFFSRRPLLKVFHLVAK